MTSSAIVFLVPVLFCWHLKLGNSQPPVRMLTSSSPGLENGQFSFVSKRDEEISPSPDYISNLWSDIENAFRFLDEQPVERSSREKSSSDNSDRIRKQEKINKLPFTQHNFIRFGKRFAQSLDTPSSSLGISEDTTSKGLKLRGILQRLKDNSYLKLDGDASELALKGGFIGQNEGQDLDRLRKRQLHKFVRIGKRYFEDRNPLHAGIFLHGAQDNDDGQNGFEKRKYSNFVRIG